MENTYILADNRDQIQQLTKDLGIDEERVISFSGKNDVDFHKLANKIGKMDIDTLIVPISLSIDNNIESKNIGLSIALHIRLNYELSVEKRLIPIVFVSDFTIENLLRYSQFSTDNNHQNIFHTKGVALSSFDVDDIKKKIAKIDRCKVEEYQKFVLSRLSIHPKVSTGKHSISNAWGCYKLALITYNFKSVIEDNEQINNQLKTPYSKYLICKNESYDNRQFGDLNKISVSGKKILFIDDQADEGWGRLMESIFETAEYVYVDSAKYKNKETQKFHNYDGFIKECESHIGKAWDLIILDLRLNPEKEDIDNTSIKPEEFSGYILLDKFLKDNKGYQIIISTASNKIWNVNKSLERGAKSYYIKESPEFNYPLSQTQKNYENLKTDIKECFKRSYLRELCKEIIAIKEQLSPIDTERYVQEVIKYLDISYDLLLSAKKNEEFAYAYVTLYMIIEVVNKEFINSNYEIEGGVRLKNWQYDTSTGEYYDDCGKQLQAAQWRSFAGLYFQKWEENDHQIVNEVYSLINKRNYFIHNDDKLKNHHDIYTEKAYLKLFEIIKIIVDKLVNN